MRSFTNHHFAGEWGKAPDKRAYRVMPIGKEAFGLFETTRNDSYGHKGIRLRIYYFTPTEVWTIADFPIEKEDNATTLSGKNRWSSTYRFLLSDKPFYDLVVHTKGLKNGKTVDEKRVYCYDGKGYRVTINTSTLPNMHRGDPLGNDSIHGLIDKHDYTYALNLSDEGCYEMVSEACVLAGFITATDQYHRKNLTRAKLYAKNAIKLGSKKGYEILGMVYARTGETDKAITAYQTACYDGGILSACRRLGHLYYTDKNTTLHNKGIVLLRSACQQGSGVACHIVQ